MTSYLAHEMSDKTTASRQHVIYDLTQELIKAGHSVTIFGSSDYNVPGATIIPISKKILDKTPAENPFYQYMSYATVMVKELEKHAKQFDIIHNHLYPEFLTLLGAQKIKTPIVTTIHTQITKDLGRVLKYFSKYPFVALSQRQRDLCPELSWMGVVYNGINLDHFDFSPKSKGYALFFGRMKIYKDAQNRLHDPKGFTVAIDVARQTKHKLKLAGNVEGGLRTYNKFIKPYLSKNIKFVGPVSELGPIGPKQKVSLYKNAKTLLNPIEWEEAFGLVMAEAMACGTPVITFDRGSAREVVQDGITGFVVKNKQEMAKALGHIEDIDRQACRKRVEQLFSRQIMAQEYEKIYYKLI